MKVDLYMSEKIRIKDIAEKSGVSVGTVDRVLHNRPNVSKSAREKVEAVLKNINYQPNMYASALAYNKSYTFYCIIPQHYGYNIGKDNLRKELKREQQKHVKQDVIFTLM